MAIAIASRAQCFPFLVQGIENQKKPHSLRADRYLDAAMQSWKIAHGAGHEPCICLEFSWPLAFYYTLVQKIWWASTSHALSIQASLALPLKCLQTQMAAMPTTHRGNISGRQKTASGDRMKP
jgi:hypothetical protein